METTPYEEKIKEIAECITSTKLAPPNRHFIKHPNPNIGKGAMGSSLTAFIQARFETSHLRAIAISEDLFTLGIVIRHRRGPDYEGGIFFEVLVSVNELDKIWKSQIFKKLIEVRNADKDWAKKHYPVKL